MMDEPAENSTSWHLLTTSSKFVKQEVLDGFVTYERKMWKHKGIKVFIK